MINQDTASSRSRRLGRPEDPARSEAEPASQLGVRPAVLPGVLWGRVGCSPAVFAGSDLLLLPAAPSQNSAGVRPEVHNWGQTRSGCPGSDLLLSPLLHLKLNWGQTRIATGGQTPCSGVRPEVPTLNSTGVRPEVSPKWLTQCVFEGLSDAPGSLAPQAMDWFHVLKWNLIPLQMLFVSISTSRH